MTTRVDLVMREDNDEVVDMTLTAVGSANLTTITSLEMFIKPSSCDNDTDPDVLKLTSGDGIVITSQTPTLLTATATIPRAALARPYERAWRLDTLVGTDRHTAMYGAITVIDL